MSLPFEIVFEAPTRADLHRLAGSRRVWLAALGFAACIVVAAALLRQSARRAEAARTAPLVVHSQPSDTIVEVDGRRRGTTPFTWQDEPGAHRVTLHRADRLDAAFDVTLTDGVTTTLQAELWRQAPLAQRLRPTFPGASIAQADFLADGRIALTVSLPPDDERQVWLVGQDGSVSRLGPAGLHGAVAVSPDGTRLAYLAQPSTSAIVERHLSEVWVTDGSGSAGRRVYTLPTNSDGEGLAELSWTPDAHGLLLVSRHGYPDSSLRTRLRWLDPVDGQARDLVSLPSETVRGSFTWDAEGGWVAFLSRTDQATSLGLLNVQTAEFRYLADLAGGDAVGLLFPPLAWSPDGRHFAYTAPSQDRPPGVALFGSKPPTTLFVGEVGTPAVQRLSAEEVQSPAWRDDRTLLALVPPARNRAPSLHTFHLDGSGDPLGDLILPVLSLDSMRWDATRAQALVASRSGGLGPTALDFWWLRFTPKEAP